MKILGTNNELVGSYRGALNVHNADVHRETVNRYFAQLSTPSTTLSAQATAGSTSITVTSATGFVVGQHIRLNTTSEEIVFPIITAIVGNVLTLNRPLDYTHNIGDVVQGAIINMNVNASLASPQSFKVFPDAGKIWHIKQLTLSMSHNVAGDFGLFGGIAALTNGVVLRRYDGATGTFGTYSFWRDNAELDSDFGTVKFVTRSGGGGTYGTSAQGSFNTIETIVYLDGTAGDYLEVLIQDNLTGLTSFSMKAQGHFEGL